MSFEDTLAAKEEEKKTLLGRLAVLEKEISELKAKQANGKLSGCEDGYQRNMINFQMPETQSILSVLNEYSNKAKETDTKVVSFAGAEELAAAFAACGVPLPLELPATFNRQIGKHDEKTEEGADFVPSSGSPCPVLGNQSDLNKIVGLFLHYSVNTSHPFFLNQLYARVDEVGLLADLMISYINTAVHTFEVAPVLTLVEGEVIRACCRLVGYKDEESEGLFVPGGAVSNTYGLLLARHHANKTFRKEGMPQSEWVDGELKPRKTGRLIAFTSEEAHYSIYKAMLLCGMGTDNLVKVKTTINTGTVSIDDFPPLSSDPNGAPHPLSCTDVKGTKNGRMCMVDLEKQLKKCVDDGNIPFFISGTAGTTVRGGFDPFAEIASLLDRLFPNSDPRCPSSSSSSSAPAPSFTSSLPRPWLHVDSCWGAGALFASSTSPLSKLVEGVEHTDSVAIDTHKQLACPLPTALIVTRYSGILQSSNGAKASYLFQKNKNNMHLDLGDLTVQCGRRGDSFKLWLMWRMKGLQHFSDRATRTLALAHHFISQITTVDKLSESLSESSSCPYKGRFVLADYTGYLNICFWYLPPSLLTAENLPGVLSVLTSTLSGKPVETEEEKKVFEMIGDAAPGLKNKMQRSGTSMIGFQPLGCLPVCFRLVFIHPELTRDDVGELLATMDRLGEGL